VVEHPGRILRDQWQNLSPARFGCWACPMKQLGKPILHRVNNAEVAVAFLSIGMPSCIPIVGTAQVITQHPDIPQR
jgi:hypothetical protein